MTENEAIKRIKEQACNDRFLAIHCDDSCLYGAEKCEWAHAIQALEKQSMVNEILHELREYSAIGTIDEFKALKEKNEPKKPIELDKWGEYWKCPICGKYAVDNFGCKYKFCPNCGTRFDWQ